MNSQVFSACKGVFQGGGCKAVAYIGAYREALARGVNFSEVSGSSGGSLVAAFIAAGATPDLLEELVINFDMNQVRKQSTRFKFVYFFLNRIPRKIETLIYNFLARKSKVKWKTWYFIVEGLHLVRYGYIYETKTLEKYIDQLLRQTTGLNRQVTFSDLRIPLTIVTSNFIKHNYEVFSFWTNPDMSVAHAIMASIAIPGFFKPVDGKYVDGCMVSNLPVFSVAEDSIYDRVLCFTTDSKSLHDEELDVLEIVKQNAETIAQGGVDIQLASIPSCYNVRIPTGDYDILQFEILTDKKTRNHILRMGADAMASFLDDKRNYRNDQFDNNIFAPGTDPLIQVSYLSRGHLKSVNIVHADCSWSENLFPLLLRWHNQGAEVIVYCLKPADSDVQEQRRIQNLSLLGCEVRFLRELPVHGYFFSYADGQYSCTLTNHAEEASDHNTRVYSHSSDQFLLRSAMSTLSEQSIGRIEAQTTLNMPIHLSAESPVRIIADLSSDNGRFAGCTIESRTVRLEQFSFPLRTVSGYKFQNLHYLYEMYQAAHLAPFSAACLQLNNHNYSLLPPIAVEQDDTLVVIDGTAQLLHAFRKSIPALDVLVITSGHPYIASNLYAIGDLILSSKVSLPETPVISMGATASQRREQQPSSTSLRI